MVYGFSLDSPNSGRFLVAGSCKHTNERSVPVKGIEFLDYLNDYQLLKTNSVPRNLSSEER